MNENSGMTHSDDDLVTVDLTDPNRGRIDRSRLGRANPDDTEPRPVVTPEDIAATLIEIAQWKRRMARKAK